MSKTKLNMAEEVKKTVVDDFEMAKQDREHAKKEKAGEFPIMDMVDNPDLLQEMAEGIANEVSSGEYYLKQADKVFQDQSRPHIMHLDLSTGGRLYAPAKLTLRTLLLQDVCQLGIAEAEEQAYQVIALFDSLIQDEQNGVKVSCAKFTKQEFIEMLVSYYLHWFGDTMEVPYTPTEDDWKARMAMEGDITLNLQALGTKELRGEYEAGKKTFTTTIKLDRIKIHPPLDGLKKTMVIKQKNADGSVAYALQFRIPLYGDIVVGQNFIKRYTASLRRPMEEVLGRYELHISAQRKQQSGQYVDYNQLPLLSVEEREQCMNFRTNAMVIGALTTNALHLEKVWLGDPSDPDVKTSDLTNQPLQTRFEVVKQYQHFFTQAVTVRVFEYFSSLKHGINEEEVVMTNPLMPVDESGKEVETTAPYSFRELDVIPLLFQTRHSNDDLDVE